MIPKHIPKQTLYEALLFILATLIVLGLPLLYYHHYSKQWIIGESNYYDLRIAHQIQSDGIPVTDWGMYKPTSVYPSLYDLFLAGLFIVGQKSVSSVVFQLSIGVCTAFLFWKILKALTVKNQVRYLCITLWILMPTFTAVYLNSPSWGLMLVLALGGFYSIMKKQYWISILVVIALLSYLISPPAFPELTLKDLLSELGGLYGFGVFYWFLIGVGIVIMWKDHTWSRGIFLLYFILLIATVMKPPLLLILSFPSAYIISRGLVYLWKRTWQISMIKNGALLAIVLGVLYSYVSLWSRLEEISLSPSLIHSINELTERSQPYHTILTYPRYGYWIEYYGRRVVIDTSFSFDPSKEEQYNDAISIFQSRDPVLTHKLLKKYNVQFIMITKEMRNGLVWDKPEQGLLFLLENTNNFKKKYSDNKIEIWELA